MTHALGRRRARVGFLYTHPIQYAAPLLRLINRSTDIEAVPIYLTDFSLRGAVDKQFGVKVVWDIDLLEGTDPIFVDGYETREVRAGLTAMPAPQLWNIVRKARLDALVIQGHVQLAVHIAMLAAKTIRIPVFYRSETHLLLPRGGEAHRPPPADGRLLQTPRRLPRDRHSQSLLLSGDGRSRRKAIQRPLRGRQ